MIELDGRALRAPQLIIVNGRDVVVGTERPYEYFKRHLARGAARWPFVVQNGKSHCCLPEARDLILEWVRAVLSSSIVGRFGFVRKRETGLVDGWALRVFEVSGPRIGGVAGDGEIRSGWIPEGAFEKARFSF